MIKLSKLHEEFISNATNSMPFDRLPVTAKEPEVPVIAVERWRLVKNPSRLVKNFVFMSTDQRNEFLMNLISYESKTRHNAILNVEESSINVTVSTKNIDSVTNIDKEYAAYCDSLFRDVMYNPIHVPEQDGNDGTIFEDLDE